MDEFSDNFHAAFEPPPSISENLRLFLDGKRLAVKKHPVDVIIMVTIPTTL